MRQWLALLGLLLLAGCAPASAAGPGAIRDRETGSRWSVLGQALDGPLAGQQLAPWVSGNHFWFAWAVFRPNTRVWEPR